MVDILKNIGKKKKWIVVILIFLDVINFKIRWFKCKVIYCIKQIWKKKTNPSICHALVGCYTYNVSAVVLSDRLQVSVVFDNFEMAPVEYRGHGDRLLKFCFPWWGEITPMSCVSCLLPSLNQGIWLLCYPGITQVVELYKWV